MRPECVVLPAPVLGQDLRLGSGGEQLGVEELIPEAAVKGFRESVLPWGSRGDIGRAGGGAGLAPVPEALGDELRTVVAADERRGRIEAGELLLYGDCQER